ncbi:MAG: N-acetylmuramoyl-L-alanine amidase [Rhodomicrobium sp.]|nr:MAG: N-acetylmuramoyl-L-alanine amidase [Rhodomicrobium sp.]
MSASEDYAPQGSVLVGPGCWVPSCNFEPRKNDGKIDLLLLHYTATPTNDYALELLTTKAGGVSSHYLIDGEGCILQLVSEEQRAWHAGEASWAGERDINSCSIGIEIQNQGAALARVPEYGRAQMQAVLALCKDITTRYNIAPSRVLAHSDVAPLRKQDPGAHFNWELLAQHGVGIVVSPHCEPDGVLAIKTADELLSLQSDLAAIGYGATTSGEMDPLTVAVITAFQRHYRPALVDGVADRSTVEAISLLLEAIEA